MSPSTHMSSQEQFDELIKDQLNNLDRIANSLARLNSTIRSQKYECEKIELRQAQLKSLNRIANSLASLDSTIM